MAHLLDKLAEVAWPFVALVALILFGKDALRKLGNLSRLKAGDVEFEFNANRAREVERDFHSSYGAFLVAADREYDRQARTQQLHDLHLVSIVKHVTNQLGKMPKTFRATVHVPDVVFRGFLYQLLDYYPGGGGRGRRFSERFGMIGQSWRLKESTGDGNAPLIHNPPANATREETIKNLIKEWGMTRAEAEGPRWTKRSVLCVLLIDSSGSANVPVGILYMDAEEQDELCPTGKSADVFARELQEASPTKSMAQSIGVVMTELRRAAADLDITVKAPRS